MSETTKEDKEKISPKKIRSFPIKSSDFKSLQRTLIDKYDANNHSFTQKLLKTLTERYIEQCNKKQDIDVFVEVDDFSSRKTYENFISQNKPLIDSDLTSEEIQQEERVRFIEPVEKEIIHYIKKYIADNVQFTGTTTLLEQQQEDTPVQNIWTVEQYREERPYITKEDLYGDITPNGKYNYYVPKPTLELHNIQTLNNKDPYFKWLQNPEIKENNKKINGTDLNTIVKKTIRIKHKVETLSDEKLVTQYSFICPRCKEVLEMHPVELGERIKHGCTGYTTIEGKPKFTSIDKSARTAKKIKSLNLYSAEYQYQGKNGIETEEIFIHTDEPDLRPTNYVMDLLITHGKMEWGEDSGTIILALGIKKKQRYDNKQHLQVPHPNTKNWCEKKGLPSHPLVDVRESIKQLYKETVGEEIDDRGAYLQYTTIISGIARTCFGFRALGVSVIANMSAGKTFPATRIAPLLDPHYMFVQSADNVSVAGFKGGVNNNKNINGRTVKMFEPGLVTKAGLLVMDEARNFYQDPQMNNALKAYLENTIRMDKVGAGEELRQNYTMIALCNFTEHDKKYRKDIKDVYQKLLRKEGDYRSDEEIEQETQKINFYLPLNHYKETLDNEVLANAVGYVREKLRSQNRCWWTGGGIEAQHRLLFDVAVWNEQKTNGKPVMPFESIQKPDSNMIPTDAFIEEIEEKWGGVIDLQDITNNPIARQEQIKSLREDIQSYLTNDPQGLEVFRHLSGEKSEMDAKTAGLIFNSAIPMQLMEDLDSTKLSDATKTWLSVLLLKSKRGISAEEYNFEKNVMTIDDYTVDFDRIDAGLAEYEKEEEAKRIAKARMELEQEQDQDDLSEWVEEPDERDHQPLTAAGSTSLTEDEIEEVFEDVQ